MDHSRLIVDPPASGTWNMAVDEALAQAIRPGDPPILRCYRWAPATLSLGYFQPLAARSEHAASQSCDVVRRASGGGAILHHHELTYCLVIPRDHPLALHSQELYRTVHATFVASFEEIGVSMALCPNRPSDPAGDGEFLCFRRRAECDLLVGEHKVGGSAQRRRAAAVLQHGSLLLSASPFAPELPGINQLTDADVAFEQILDLWLPRMAETLHTHWMSSSLTDFETRYAQNAQSSRYANETWIARK